MSRFYLGIWVRWIAAFVLIAFLLAVGFASVITFGSYLFKGLPELDTQTMDALKTIWLFWFGIGYGVGMVGALASAIKYVCNRCVDGYRIVFSDCQGETIEKIGLKRYFKVWRKWFFSLIWINAAQVVLIVVLHQLIFGGTVWMGWFTPWWLTPMILVSGLFAFPITIYRCKNIRIVPCTL